MAVSSKTTEREVLVKEDITVKDFQGDTMSIILSYNSTEEPEGAALMLFDITDKGERGTWVTSEDLREMSAMLISVADSIDVARKKPPAKTRTRKATKAVWGK